MKLARNAVYAITTEFNNANNFVHINKNGKINPFFLKKHGFDVHGELRNHPEGLHEHWNGAINSFNCVMVQSHVTKPSEVDFKKCRKFARNYNRKQ